MVNTIACLPIKVARADRWIRRAHIFLLLAAISGFASFLYQTGCILAFSYETEHWEGSEVLASSLLTNGQSCYGWPTSDAAYPVPFYPYPPVFPAVSALCRISLKGIANHPVDGLATVRMIAVLSAVLCGIVTARVVYRRTGAAIPALIAGLLLFAVEPHHRYLNVARPDTIGLLAAMLALSALDKSDRFAMVRFCIWAALSAFCKQPFVIIGLVGVWHVAGRNRLQGCLCGIGFAGLLAGGALALNIVTHGAFWSDVAVYQHLVKSDTIHVDWQPWHGLLSWGGRLITWSLPMQLPAFAYAMRHWHRRHDVGGQWILAYVAVTPWTLFTLLQWGVFANRLLPAVAFCNILFGMALAETAAAGLADGKGVRMWRRLVPLLAVVPLVCHTPQSEKVDTSEMARDSMVRLEETCRRAQGPVLSEMPFAAVISGSPDAVVGFSLLKPLVGMASQPQIKSVIGDLDASRYEIVVLYVGFGQPCAFLGSPVMAALQTHYEKMRTGDNELYSIYRRRDNRTDSVPNVFNLAGRANVGTSIPP